MPFKAYLFEPSHKIHHYKKPCLATELFIMVGAEGLEPPTLSV
jgi:hypothetical protein